ncbi:hypothetical protein [Hyalangium gracile]|uniref:hypothetical protein n=1 Tax=Hyalangium gracile TaxID=394092 RepID=UPI001CCE6E9A|nr:hypothetical protein [Hyalangium gracile]
MRDTAGLWFVLVSALFILVPLYFIWRVYKKQLAAWAEFASRHALHAQKLRIEGSYEGYQLTLETQRRGGGKQSYTVTVLRLSVGDSLPPDFSLEREGLGDKILKVLGSKDAELGDPEFDKRFSLANLSEETAAILRRSAVQQLLYEMVDQYRAFHIRDGWIHAERGGIPSTADALEDLTGPALMLAHTLEESSRRLKNQTRS